MSESHCCSLNSEHYKTNIEHLEIKEDLLKLRLDKATKILTDYCKEYEISNIRQMKNKLVIEELVEKLIKYSGLSLRKISELIEMPFSKIQRINKNTNSKRQI